MDTMLSWGRVGLLFCILQQVSYIESAVHRDVDILLAWKATLREGHCLGCRDGPVLRNWTREKGICEWWDLIPVAGVDDLQQRGVTRCSDPNQQVHKV